jgi:16S rRNA (cytosine1402-N4)-methyltransferase
VSRNDPAPAGGYHRPVMAGEVVEIFRPLQSGLLIDATYGGGGHSAALLEAMPDLRILAIDRDPDARARAEPQPRIRLVQASFGSLATVAREALASTEAAGDPQRLVGALFDLGVSSFQLDTAERGFSYRRRGPLDMRMDRAGPVTAYDVVNEWDRNDLADTFRRYGEERYASRIASAIVGARPIDDTAALAQVIAEAVPAAARRRRHPARRVFQAIRIAVNDELGELERGLEAALELVAPLGRVAVITYHSLEDRAVKRRFASGASECECPPGLPVCTCGKVSELRLLTRKGLTPSVEEIEANPRARSARLRAVEKVAS